MLLTPAHDPSSTYRLYDEQQMRQLRVVALLRKASYSFDEICAVLHELSSGRAEKAILAVEKRSEELARLSWKCIEGLATMHQYICAYCPELVKRSSL